MSDQDDIKDLPLDVEHQESEQDAKPAETGETSDGAGSSPAQDAPKDGGDDELLSVAREVIDKHTKPKPDEGASSAENSGAEETGAQTRKEQDDENFSDVPFHKHRRFQQVLGRMKAAEQDAGRYRNVEAFISNAGLNADTAAEALVIAGMMRTDPARAWKTLQPILQNLLVAAGEALPPELQQRVDQGQLTHDAALEISRATATTRSLEARQRFDTDRAEQERRNAHVLSLSDAAVDWENERQTKDPNFAAKMPALEREILYLHRTEGVPDTPDGVRKQLKRAYDAVNAQFRPPQSTPAPRRQPITPVRGGQVAASGAAQKPQYNSTLDIIRAKTGARAAS